MLRPTALVALLVAALSGCAEAEPTPLLPPPPSTAPPAAAQPVSTTPETGPPAAPASVAAAPEMAPTPYTADQIRDAQKKGRVYRFKMEVAGQPAAEHLFTFVAVDADGADIETTEKDASGKPIGQPEKSHATWEELRKHAEFPADATKIADETITVPAGKFDCRVYTVTRGTGADTTVTKFYFAKELPGPPVLLQTEKGGTRVRTNTLLQKPK
jgi:hypothetical protein